MKPLPITAAVVALALQVPAGWAAPPDVTGAAATPPAAEAAHSDALREDPALGLRDAFQAALQREPRRGTVAAQRAEAKALGRYGDSLLADAPALSVRHQTDRIGSDTGLREWETGVDLPLWRPGQRRASQGVAQGAAHEADAGAAALALDVAGSLREALWEVALQTSNVRQAQADLDASRALAGDVARRVKAGDLARQDQLLADSAVLARESALVMAHAALADAQRRYAALTGLDRIPATFREARDPETEITPQHPRLTAAVAMVERAAAARDLARTAGTASPTVTVGTRHERDPLTGSYVDSVGMTLRVPLNTATHSGPARAAAARAYAEAAARRDLLQRELRLALHEAEHSLMVAGTERDLARRERDLTRERLRLGRIAFAHGELDLVELLRIQSAAFTQERIAESRALEYERAIARYNQAVGVLP